MSTPMTATRRKKITLQEVEAIAELCSKRLNETESCNALGISPRTWFQWKRRHAVEFEAVLTRVRAVKILAHMNNIESFSAKDWRASAYLLKVIAPERFGDRPAPIQVNVAAIAENILLDALQRAYGTDRNILEDTVSMQ